MARMLGQDSDEDQADDEDNAKPTFRQVIARICIPKIK